VLIASNSTSFVFNSSQAAGCSCRSLLGMAPLNDTFLGLRSQALLAAAHGLLATSPAHASVSGALVDIPVSGGFVTVVAMTDDSTSHNTSLGAGWRAAGSRQTVARASQSLLAVIEANLEIFTEVDEGEFPPPGHVRFHVLGPVNTAFADVSEDSFWGLAPHTLTPVIGAAQDVISAIHATDVGFQPRGRQTPFFGKVRFWCRRNGTD